MAGNTVAIVQARLGSSRLPLKSLLSLRGKPIIDWVLARLAASAKLDKIVVAIPDTPLDRVLAQHLDARGTTWIAGSENDVLDRFIKAARITEAKEIVRVCADNPLISGEAVDRLIDFFHSGRYDYAYNHIPRNNLWPDGLGAEIVSRPVLEELGLLAQKGAQREHCLNYIWDNPRQFAIGTFDPAEKWLQRPDLKLDIDSPDDFQRLALLPIEPGIDTKTLVNVCGRTQP